MKVDDNLHSCRTHTGPASIHLDEKRVYQFSQCRRPTPFIYLNQFIRAHTTAVSPPCCFSFAVCANCINMPRGLMELLRPRTMSGPLRACAVSVSKHQGMFLLRLAVSGPMISWSHLDSRILEAPPKSRDRRKCSAQSSCPPTPTPCTLVPENTWSSLGIIL